MTTPAPTLEDIWRLFQETDRQFKETDRQFKETDRQFKETARLSRETDLKFQETDRLISRIGRQLGELGGRLGQFVEEMVRPAVVRLFRERGLEVHEVHRGIFVERDGEAAEYDLVVVNDAEAIAVECKSALSTDDVREHLERLAKFKRLVPKYREVRLLGAVAAMVLPDDVARYAYRRGLFVLGPNGEDLMIRNDAKFVPKVW